MITIKAAMHLFIYFCLSTPLTSFANYAMHIWMYTKMSNNMDLSKFIQVHEYPVATTPRQAIYHMTALNVVAFIVDNCCCNITNISNKWKEKCAFGSFGMVGQIWNGIKNNIARIVLIIIYNLHNIAVIMCRPMIKYLIREITKIHEKWHTPDSCILYQRYCIVSIL